MKIIKLIKSFKFLDFRKYIGVNLIAAASFCLCILVLIRAIKGYPPPINADDFFYEYHPKEQMIINGEFICASIMFFLPFTLLPELLVRAAVEFLHKKFFSKKINMKPFALKFPKTFTLIYSVILYTGSIFFFYLFCTYFLLQVHKGF